MDRAKFKCDVCGETNFNLNEGFYYCSECGTQSKQMIDVEIEENFVENSKHFKSTIKIKTIESDKVELTTWEVYNYILRGLVEELINLGAKEELKVITLQLWAAYLRQNEVAFFSKNHPKLPKFGVRYNARDAKILYNHVEKRRKKKKTASKSSAASMSSREWTIQKKKFAASEYETSQSEMSQSSFRSTSMSDFSSGSTAHRVRLSFTNKAMKLYKKQMPLPHFKKHLKDVNNELTCHNMHIKSLNTKDRVDLLKRRTIYSILNIALNLIEDDIQLSDVLRFMREGHISTKNVIHFFPENLHSICQKTFESVSLFKFMDYYSDNFIRRNSLELCKTIHMFHLETPDIRKLTRRYTSDLALPDEIGAYIERIINIYPPEMKYRPGCSVMPCYEGRAMAYIIFALKLLFGLDGHKEKIISKSAADFNEEMINLNIDSKLFVWQDWVRYIEMRKLILVQCHSATSMQFKMDLTNDQYIEQLREENRNAEDVVKPKNQAKFMNMQRIFETFRVKFEMDEECTLMKFPPSLTPNKSYFMQLLRDQSINAHIPDFMSEDFTKTSLEPFVRSKNLQSMLRSKSIKFEVDRIPCTDNTDYVGVCRKYRPNKFGTCKVRQVDFKVTTSDWLSSVLDKKENKQIFLRRRNKTKSTKKSVKNVVPESSYIEPIPDIHRVGLPPPRRDLDKECLFDDLSDDDENETNKESCENFYKSLKLAVSNLDYWTLLGKMEEFENIHLDELKNKFPISFCWLLNYCSNMIGIEWNVLYRELLIVESNFIFVLEKFDYMKNMIVFQNKHHEEDIQKYVEFLKTLW